MNAVAKAFNILRFLGPRIVWLRAGTYVEKRLGTTRKRYAPVEWDAIDLRHRFRGDVPSAAEAYAAYRTASPPTFMFPIGAPPAPSASVLIGAERTPTLVERIALLRDFRCVCFFKEPTPGPVDWNVNPFDGRSSFPERTWCDIPDFLPTQGEMRGLWEPSRAAWAIDLARARGRGVASDTAELYWRWVESWMQHNPPWRGFQWKCGQESSVRMMALAIGLWAVARDPQTTPARWVAFAKLAWATAHRVVHHIDYAISQKNNHALSEACGLMLLAQLFPEFADAPRWADVGRRVLGAELQRQIYTDGSYVQHSTNYHRVMLDVACLGLRLAELAQRPFDRRVYDCVGRAAEFLHQISDERSGGAPNYGSNDGAWVLPLCDCDFADYRPAIQAAHYLVHRKRLLPVGPWDESLLWLFGSEVLASQPETQRAPASNAFSDGGYYTLRSAESWLMTRCHTYRDRPAHVDMLHVDLWWRGQNVLCDSGSFQYYTPDDPNVEKHFKSIAAHNTIEIDGANPLELVSRFLWLPWPRARELRFDAATDGAAVFSGEHYAYDRAPWRVVHRRTIVMLDADVWVIVDDLLGEGEHDFRSRWHLLDAPAEFVGEARRATIRSPRGKWSIAAGATAAVEATLDRGGWSSRYYSWRTPIPRLTLAGRAALPVRLVMLAGPSVHAPPERIAAAGSREYWTVHDGAGERTLVLARARRDASHVLIEIRDGAPDRAVP